MRSAMCGLVGVGLLVSACGGTKPAVSEPTTAKAPRVAAPASCERRHAGVGAVRLGSERQGSTVALARSGSATVAYVADEDDDVLHTIDVGAGAQRATTPLSGSPSQVLVLADGRVAVALRDKNQIQILEPAERAEAPLETLCSVKVPTEPVALAATPDDKRVLVTSAWAKKLTSLDAASFDKPFSVDVAREPRAVIVDDDGQRAFVSHVVGAKMSVVDLAGDKHDVRSIDLRAKKMVGSAEDSKVRGGCQGFALAKSVDADSSDKSERPMVKGTVLKEKAPAAPRGRIFAPMVTVDPGEAQVRSAGYGNAVDQVPVEAPIVSVIDSSAERSLTRQVLADGRRHTKECLLPRAATYNPVSSTLLVTCLGTDTLVEMDSRGFDPSRLERRRWSVPAGPTGVAVDTAASRAVVWSQFDRELAVIDLAAGKGSSAAVVRVPVNRKAKSKVTPQIAWGREIFHKTDDTRISGDGRACASCHPDGREDALTWSTPEGPRQTIMLAGRIEGTAPYAWFGNHADLKTHVKTTFTRLGGTGLPDHDGRYDELDALVAYLNAMPAPAQGTEDLAGAQLELVARGKKLFFAEQQGCASCHVGGAGTDSDKHDIGSGVSADPKPDFDTPSLRFVSGTAPYFHDGRYSTLDELLASSDSKMGHTMQLSRRDVTALKAYLETL